MGMAGAQLAQQLPDVTAGELGAVAADGDLWSCLCPATGLRNFPRVDRLVKGGRDS